MAEMAFIGAGKMAEAILKTLLRAGWLESGEVILSDIDKDRLKKMAADYGTRAAESNTAAAGKSGIVLLAVKPKNLEGVLREISGSISRKQIVVSIAMGKSLASIEELLQEGVPVVRVMPNNPAMVGAAVSVLSYGRSAGDDIRRKIRDMFACVGEVYELPEEQQDEAMALSGCGPAYFYVMAEALCDAGVKLGLERSLAFELVTGTMIGSGMMLRDTGLHPALLRDMVTSPGGSTIAALESLEESGLRSAFYRAVIAAWRRAKEV